jgi:hypothetical protein
MTAYYCRREYTDGSVCGKRIPPGRVALALRNLKHPTFCCDCCANSEFIRRHRARKAGVR